MNLTNTTPISVQVPFPFCEKCPRMDVETTKCYSSDTVFCTFFRCSYAEICADAVELYLSELETEKAENRRPVIAYDNIMQILTFMENEAEEHPECQLKAAPLIRKIARICDNLKE